MMHRIIGVGLLASLTLAATAPSNVIGPLTKVQVTPPIGSPVGGWLDTNGQPEASLVELELAISGPTVDLAAGGAPLATARGLDPFAPSPTLGSLGLVTATTPVSVRLWARVYDGAGNPSGWFRADEVIDAAPPKAPGGCQLLR
jgi:hypothetical protein